MTMAPDTFVPAAWGRPAPETRPDDAGSPHAWVEAKLARYPDLPPEEIDRLVAWFEREASALDVGTIASEARLARPYRQFKAERIDPLTPRDLGRAALFVAVVGLALLGVAWLSP